MFKAAKLRYIEGLSCAEIVKTLEIGISRTHLCDLTNIALDINTKIHNEKSSEISAYMGKYILQIDGTIDGDYWSIVTVRDALSGFILYGKRSPSESYEDIKQILNDIKARFGVPVGAISDMRSGIIKALNEIFPSIPKAICKYHFLRDLGRDLLQSRHLKLGKMITDSKIKSTLKKGLIKLPKYDQKILREIEYGYCQNKETLALMGARSIVENLVSIRESSGYGFPFFLKHLKFVNECEVAKDKLKKLNSRMNNTIVQGMIEELEKFLFKKELIRIRDELSRITDLFDRLKKAMHISDARTPLSENYVNDTALMHLNSEILIRELEIYMYADIPQYLFSASKHIINEYRKRESTLFLNDLGENNIPNTNNELEQVFRRVRRNIRKRNGNTATGDMLKRSGEGIILFQNLRDENYLKVVYGSGDIAALFGKERMYLKKESSIGRKKMYRIIEKGIDLLLSGKLPETPYNEEMWSLTATIEHNNNDL